MRPYYEHAGITIYHADCREIFSELIADVRIAGVNQTTASWATKIQAPEMTC